MENEAWDGSVENTIKIVNAIGHDEIEEEVVQTPCTSQCTVPSTTAMQILVQTTAVRTTCAQSTPREKQTPVNSPSSFTYLDPTLASLLQRKTRSLCDIYNDDTTNSFFSFFSIFTNR